jgi:hypothetical protein
MQRWTTPWAVLAVFLMTAGTLDATIIPDALFQAGAGEQASFTPMAHVNVATDTTGPQSVNYNGTSSSALLHGMNATLDVSAQTSGAPGLDGSPSVNVHGSTTGEIATAPLGAAARITYYVGVDALDGAPVRSVPIILHAVGSVSAAGPVPYLGSRVTSGVWLGSSLNQWCYIELGDGSWPTPVTLTYDNTTTIYVTSGGYYKVLINAAGSALGFLTSGDDEWHFSASADPTATIDPSYAYADQYVVTMSPNVLPEPATLSLLALGGLGVLVRRRHR